MNKNIKATEGRLVVKKIEAETTTAGGIFLAQPDNQNIHKGEVVSVGYKKPDTQQDFCIGDIVYWQNYSGVEFTADGEDYLILNQSDIIAVD